MQKLDKFAKQRIRSELRRRQEAALVALGEEIKTLLAETACRLIRAEWADKQEDMVVLAKYRHAARVKGANLRLRDPETNNWNIAFGIECDPGCMIPAQPWGGNGDGYTYWHGYVRDDDPAHDRLMEFHRFRLGYQQAQREEQIALDAAMRKTTSIRRLAESYPWVGEIYPQ